MNIHVGPKYTSRPINVANYYRATTPNEYGWRNVAQYHSLFISCYLQCMSAENC